MRQLILTYTRNGRQCHYFPATIAESNQIRFNFAEVATNFKLWIADAVKDQDAE